MSARVHTPRTDSERGGLAVGDSNGNGNGSHIALVISLIVPTKNERDNIEPLVTRLERVLHGRRVEIIFVDDSDDGTPAAIERVQGRSQHEIVLIHRPADRRSDGLGGAVAEGMAAARAPWVCVMDADLQHPPELVDRLVAVADAGDSDVVVATRYAGDGEAAAGLGSAVRTAVSALTGGAAKLLFPRRLAGVSDPMSGFFLVRKSAVAMAKLQPRGFKILLEILVRSAPMRVSEVPFRFGERHAGDSKASLHEGLVYLLQLCRLRAGNRVLRMARFGFVGASGLPVNVLFFWLFASAAHLHYLLAAAVATQLSTLWLFVLTDRWVFRRTRQERSLAGRAALYFGMNNAALALRGPMLVVLVSTLGMASVLANLVSLLSLTLIRFALADTWIWGAGNTRGRDVKAQPFAYDIHGLLSVVSEVVLPELERFGVERSIESPTIRVRIGRLSRAQSDLVSALAQLVRHVRYDEGLGRFGFGIDIALAGKTIEIVASPLLRRSPHVLYTNVVEPILRWTFVKNGYSLVHGACLEFDGAAYLITARTDTGKTTTILKTLDNYPCGFLSDDLTLISPDGRVLTYPKPLTISRHTVKAIRTPLLSLRERGLLFYQSRVHSKSGREVAFVLTRFNLPIATINALVQLIVPPPKYHVERLVPHVRTVEESQLAGLIVIERGHDDRRELDPDEALEILMRNCADSYGFPPYEALEAFLQQGRNGDRDLVEKEREIVGAALRGASATLVGSTTMAWWQELPGIVGFDATPSGRSNPVPTAVPIPAVD